MKQQSLLRTATVACVMSVGGLAMAQMGGTGGMHHEHGATTQPAGEGMQERHQALMQHMQKMEQERKEMDQRLADKVAAMDKAQGQAKIDAMADVIKELVQQRQTIDRNHMETMNRMMERMGGDDGRKESR